MRYTIFYVKDTICDRHGYVEEPLRRIFQQRHISYGAFQMRMSPVQLLLTKFHRYPIASTPYSSSGSPAQARICPIRETPPAMSSKL